MDLVALFSGGKDSVYALVEAVRLGHRVACLANLHPPRSEELAPPPLRAFGGAHATPSLGAPQELDSFLLQTVGWNVVPALATAMGVPLVTRATRGCAVHTGMTYPATAAAVAVGGGDAEVDEVEDMHALLADVVRAHPSVRGVCVGAILSSYQRARVEAVCARLGLVPVALLWQREQGHLLEEMHRSGIEAALVKVAACGLTPAMLGKPLSLLLPTLLRLRASTGLNVAGEGGEFETLALDSPLHAHARVALLPDEGGHATEHGRGGVAHLSVARVSLLPKDAAAAAAAAALLRYNWRESADSNVPQQLLPLPPLQLPPLLPPLSEALLDTLPHARLPFEELLHGSAPTRLAAPEAAFPRIACVGDQLFVSGITGTVEGGTAADAPGAAARQARAVLEQLRSLLRACGSVMCDVLAVHLYLSALDRDFGAVNAVFSEFWGAHPPSRSCVGILPAIPGALVSLDAIAHAGSGRAVRVGFLNHRATLHVASLSKWAPLCIGPYCQAVTLEGSLIFSAGQIGLRPEAMALTSPRMWPQLRQALLNLTRVLAAADGAITRCVSAVVYVAAGVAEGEGVDADALSRAVRAIVASWLCGRFGGSWRKLVRADALEEGSNYSGATPGGDDDDDDAGSGSDDDGDEREGDCAAEREVYLGAVAHSPPAYVASLLREADRSAEFLPPNTASAEGVICPALHAVASLCGEDLTLPPMVLNALPLHPCAVVTVPMLPRGAAVEVECWGLTAEAERLLGGLRNHSSPLGATSHCSVHFIPRALVSAWVAVAAGTGKSAGGGSALEGACVEAIKSCHAALQRAVLPWEGAHLRIYHACEDEGMLRAALLAACAAEGEAALPPALTLVRLHHVLSSAGGSGEGGTATLLVHLTAYAARHVRGTLFFARNHRE